MNIKNLTIWKSPARAPYEKSTLFRSLYSWFNDHL